MSRKEKKQYDDDDGHTIIDMNMEGMQGYVKPEHRRNLQEMKKLNISKKEKRAIFWGSFLAALPGIIISALCFTAAFVLVYFWLK